MLSCKSSKVNCDGSAIDTAVATDPLTNDEEWQPLPETKVAAFVGGKRIC